MAELRSELEEEQMKRVALQVNQSSALNYFFALFEIVL